MSFDLPGISHNSSTHTHTHVKRKNKHGRHMENFFPFFFFPKPRLPNSAAAVYKFDSDSILSASTPRFTARSFEKWKLSQSWKLFPESDQKSTENRQWQWNFSVENKNRSSNSTKIEIYTSLKRVSPQFSPRVIDIRDQTRFPTPHVKSSTAKHIFIY